jgi:four helix bundle protein
LPQTLSNGNYPKIEDLQIWQKARLLSQRIYPVTFKENVGLDFRLKDQLRGHCGSVMDDIAEGFE